MVHTPAGRSESASAIRRAVKSLNGMTDAASSAERTTTHLYFHQMQVDIVRDLGSALALPAERPGADLIKGRPA